ncbi:hypothetical protein ACFUCV_06580 [Specibacter sp. NPDC057265]|uniref:hypothetical protein n=1 Tax=Specibacter sp. NPDC057265 TaxID=3346075 RepID=UPI0036399E9D
MKAATLSTCALAAVLGASAVNHLRNPAFYYPVVPRILCRDRPGTAGHNRGGYAPWAPLTRHGWVIASAVPEALGAVGLLIPATRGAAATATALMFAAFTAGHVAALHHAAGPEGTAKSRLIHALRLPVQLPLVAWAWRARHG